MLRTIIIGSCVFVQGTFIRTLGNGRIAIRVGNREFTGRPVSRAA